MSIRENTFVGYKEINELGQTLIENLTVYTNLVNRMNVIQPKLSLTYILKKDICWIIGNLERLKQDDYIIDYRIGWRKNTLKTFSIIYNKVIGIMTYKLIRHELIHNNNDNIRFTSFKNIN